MKLIGSFTSPYVRRVRRVMKLLEINYHFEALNLMSSEHQRFVKDLCVLRLIPILQHRELVLSDSRIIVNYLWSLKNEAALSWQEQQNLTIIDELNDILIQFLLMERSNIELDWKSAYFANKRQRLKDGFDFLEQHLEEILQDEKLTSIYLFSLLDWLEFRQMWSLKTYSQLYKWWREQAKIDHWQQTDPRGAL